MGIGTTAAKQLLSTTNDRAEIAACVDLLNEALHAIDTAEPAALATLKETHAEAFEQARVAEMSKRLAELDKPRDEKPVETVPVKPSEPSKVK